ncbi:unnamed protein product [Haemonchus placei]|uniref:G protein-coupled receptor n=1 Tax=Haemonchus placei TaxID=6290 RepID=A0A0N4WLI0_HAEPC|nr:unnamed protein product [Haemonchus placei]
MDTQATTVVMELGVRLMTMCLPMAHMTKVVDHSAKWKLFIAVVSLPLILATPLYCIFNFQYGLKGTEVPILLSSPDVTYYSSIFYIGLVYRVTALVLCLCGYVYMFDTIRRKGLGQFKIHVSPKAYIQTVGNAPIASPLHVEVIEQWLNLLGNVTIGLSSRTSTQLDG